METSFFKGGLTKNLQELLVIAGYLAIADIISIADSIYVLMITNWEIQIGFRRLTAYHFSNLFLKKFKVFNYF